ncbi:ATP-dependent RNA helicase DDX19A-like isoform X2 [Argiope bruennichi]|uniref:ATP-dependent RNA helicase DDX19A like protein n=2 Tax=Argiope bruennichi TaxID=94029 RepID=A0A8T0F6D3_ARGBR|nr:ATP-dependent RNA helicase DDX19A-like isoform X2 [Argiope bruennichi]XP_055927326.1 ATP-dependent RNA helicase DDX19A-like isoform X2 [Argiope bruennichi]KAF8785962.1 ATP-dependent RNA helicase DDX19A like protein [Argiope bruennichi]
MSTWDQCCKHGKFNANFSKTKKTDKDLRKIEKVKNSENSDFPENKVHTPYSRANKKEEFTEVKNATNVEIQLSFFELGLNNCLIKWIESLGFSSPNRVQNKVLYHLSESSSEHIVIKAPKKSGKTSATLIWVLNKLLNDKNKEYPNALMICPTFEIADATYKFVEQISKYCDLKIYPAMKGTKLSRSDKVVADLVIATPDKALELSKLTFNLKNAKYLIFDDAHCMSGDVGNLKTVSRVCSLLSSKCTIILCTLFCNKVLDNFINKFLVQNQRIEIENDVEKVTPKEIFIVHSNKEERVRAFIYLVKSNSFEGQTVVFCRTKEESYRLESALDDENISVKILNGDLKPPSKRSDILQQFKENKIQLLITTYTFMEVLEAENVTKVINYEQVLSNETKRLDPNIYNQIENLLNGRKNCLIGSFIEKKWEDVLIQPRPGAVKKVYANATSISANDLIDGQTF